MLSCMSHILGEVENKDGNVFAYIRIRKPRVTKWTWHWSTRQLCGTNEIISRQSCVTMHEARINESSGKIEQTQYLIIIFIIFVASHAAASVDSTYLNWCSKERKSLNDFRTPDHEVQCTFNPAFSYFVLLNKSLASMVHSHRHNKRRSSHWPRLSPEVWIERPTY